jgi:outer membrane protein assembly factor BamB
MISGVLTSVVYVLGGDGTMYAIDAVKGTQIWNTPAGGPVAISSPAVVDRVVYVVSGGLKGAIYALDAEKGGVLWYGPAATHYTSPAVSGGWVYVADDSGKLSAFNTAVCSVGFCTPVWTSQAINGFPPMKSSPSVANGTVFVGADDGNLYAFDAVGIVNCTGKTCKPLWTGTMKGPVRTSPAVVNGVVYASSGDGNPPGSSKLYAFDAAGVNGCTGGICSPLWTGALNGNFPESSPAAANGVVYVGSDDHYFYAFDANGCSPSTQCNPIAKISTGDVGTPYLASSPVVANGWIYVGSSDGNVNILGVCYITCLYWPPTAVD